MTGDSLVRPITFAAEVVRLVGKKPLLVIAWEKLPGNEANTREYSQEPKKIDILHS